MSKDGFSDFAFASFSKLADHNVKKFSKDPNTPSWRTVYPGLNFEGKCINRTCNAFNKKVWAHLGYGLFNVGK
jgi:hypothetical protein